MAGFSTLAPPVFPSGTAASDWYGLCCFLAYFLCFPNSLGIESWCSVSNILSFLQCYLPLSPCNFHLAGALPILHSLCSSCIEAIYCRLGSSGARAGLFLNFRVSYLSQGLCCSREQSGASGALNSSLVVSQFLPVLVRPKTSLCKGNAQARKERTLRWQKLTAWALHHRCPKGEQMPAGVPQELKFLNQSRNSPKRHGDWLPSSIIPLTFARSFTPWKTIALFYCVIYL